MGNSSSQDNQYFDAKVMEQEDIIQNERIADLSDSLERINLNSKQKELDRQQNSRIQMIQDAIVDSESNNASIIGELSNSLKKSLASQTAVVKNMQSQSATLANQWKSQSANLQNWQKESKAWRDKVQSQLNINSDSVASNVARIKGLDSSIANNAKSITGLNENVNTKFSALSSRIDKVEANVDITTPGIATNAESITNMNTRVNGMDTHIKDMSMFMLKKF
jgi:chromosome segregation ATPase